MKGSDDAQLHGRVMVVNSEVFYTSFEKKMKGGLFSIMVLHVINSSGSPIHGYRITQFLDDLTEGTIHIQAGTIYPILRNLEGKGLIEHSDERSARGPPRKAYWLTSDGEQVLKEINRLMDTLLVAIDKVRTNNSGSETDSMDPRDKSG
jgi:PadR family transcriptional regulator PadR